MRIHLLEHEPEDYFNTNINFWSAENGHRVVHSNIFKNENLPLLDTFDWLMVMGGPQHTYEEDKHHWLGEEKQFIRDVITAGKVVVGICFGAQLLAEALGGNVFPAGHKEIGWHEVSLTPQGRESFLFQNIPERFVTFHWHGDQFSLPRGCSCLGFSEASPNQAFICDQRPLLGFQFHPEYTREMIRNSGQNVDDEWTPGRYVAGKAAILEKTEKIPDTYWLMEILLDNLQQEFGTDIIS